MPFHASERRFRLRGPAHVNRHDPSPSPGADAPHRIPAERYFSQEWWEREWERPRCYGRCVRWHWGCDRRLVWYYFCERSSFCLP